MILLAFFSKPYYACMKNMLVLFHHMDQGRILTVVVTRLYILRPCNLPQHSFTHRSSHVNFLRGNKIVSSCAKKEKKNKPSELPFPSSQRQHTHLLDCTMGDNATPFQQNAIGMAEVQQRILQEPPLMGPHHPLPLHIPVRLSSNSGSEAERGEVKQRIRKRIETREEWQGLGGQGRKSGLQTLQTLDMEGWRSTILAQKEASQNPHRTVMEQTVNKHLSSNENFGNKFHSFANPNQNLLGIVFIYLRTPNGNNVSIQHSFHQRKPSAE